MVVKSKTYVTLWKEWKNLWSLERFFVLIYIQIGEYNEKKEIGFRYTSPREKDRIPAS